MENRIKGLTYTPTGLVRYRAQKRIFGKPLVVLQVQYRVKGKMLSIGGVLEEYDFDIYEDASTKQVFTKTSNWC